MKIKRYKQKKENVPICILCKKDSHTIEEVQIGGSTVKCCSQCKTKLIVK